MAAACVPRGAQSVDAPRLAAAAKAPTSPEQARVWSTLEFISYRYLTIAAAYHRGAGCSRSTVSAALTGS
jgi:hypothetical protein